MVILNIIRTIIFLYYLVKKRYSLNETIPLFDENPSLSPIYYLYYEDE